MQQVVNGLFLGSIYALFALGYTLVFGVLDILNLAHAAVFTLCAFLALALKIAIPAGFMTKAPTNDLPFAIVLCTGMSLSSSCGSPSGVNPLT